MNGKVCEGNVNTRDELFPRIFDAAARITKSEDQLKQKHAFFKHEIQIALRLGGGIS